VRDAYVLKEERYMSTWSDVTLNLEKYLSENRHVEFYLSPYPEDGSKEHQVMVATRNVYVPKSHEKLTNTEVGRSYMAAVSKIFGKTEDTFGVTDDIRPSEIPHRIIRTMKTIVGTCTGVSHKVFQLGDDAGYFAYAIELGFPISDKNDTFNPKLLFDAINEIFNILKQCQLSDQYMTNILSLRFIKKSNAYLSMMHGANTAMLEFEMISDTFGGQSILRRLNHQLYKKYGGKMRCHWGLNLDGFNGDYVRRSYPEYSKWKKIYRQLNSKSTFDNSWSLRMGLDRAETREDEHDYEHGYVPKGGEE